MIRVEAMKGSEPSKVSSRPFFIEFAEVFEPVVAVTTRCPGLVTRSSLAPGTVPSGVRLDAGEARPFTVLVGDRARHGGVESKGHGA